MINLGSTSIADVKFGSQQMSKAYHGADLVWSNLAQYEFSNSSAYMTGSSGSSALGFTITDKLPSGSTRQEGAWNIFANNSRSMFVYMSKNATTIVNFVFPDELGDVILLDIKGIQVSASGAGYSRAGSVTILTSPLSKAATDDDTNGANGFRVIKTISGSTQYNNFFTNTYGNNVLHPPTVKTLRIKFSSANGGSTPSEKYKMRLLVNPDNLAAWKAKYNIS